RGQFPANAGAKLQCVLPHHLLRLLGALCCQHVAAWVASVPVWLRCAERGVGHVAGRVLCRRRNACRALRAWPGDVRPEVTHGRPTDHGRRALLDVSAEPRDQPGPSHLASRGAGPWTFDMLCPRECSGLPLYATVAAWGGGWFVESAAQRGRQRGDVVGADNAGAP